MSAQAYCINIGSIFPQVTINVPSTLSIPRDKYQVGDTILDTGRIGNVGAVNTIQCSSISGDYEWGLIAFGPLATALPAAGSATPGLPPPSRVVYNTNVPGIGISISYFDNALNPGGTSPLPIYSAADKIYWRPLADSFYRNAADYQVKLIKTGPISPGVLQLAGNVVQVWYGGGNAPNYANSTLSTQMFFSNDINISLATCSISNPSVTVPLPKVSSAALSGPDTAAGVTAFDINMQCGNTRVSYQLNANQYSASYYSLIVPTGTASGVAVDLQDRSTTPWSGVHLNSKTLLLDTSGSSNVAVKLPLAARYYRPSGAVALQPGSVTATATLTMFYE